MVRWDGNWIYRQWAGRSQPVRVAIVALFAIVAATVWTVVFAATGDDDATTVFVVWLVIAAVTFVGGVLKAWFDGEIRRG